MNVQLTALLAGGGNIIDLDGTLFVLIGLFFLLFFILRSLVFGPVMRTIDAREQAIDGAKVEAATVRKEADAMAEHFREKLREVRQSAGRERERLQAEGAKIEAELIETARSDVRETTRAAESRLEAELVEARTDLQSRVPGLAAAVASRVLGREVRS